jgi:hypothetical protein
MAGKIGMMVRPARKGARVKVSYALILSAAVLVGGCMKHKQTTKKPSDDFANTPATPAPETPTYSSSQLRDALLASDQTLKIAIVAQVDQRNMTATGTTVQDGDFKVDDAVAIINVAQQPVANGVVVGASAGGVTVKYNVIPNGRPPRESDLILKFAK